MDQQFETVTGSSARHAGWMPAIPQFEPPARPRRGELPLHELEFRPLRTPSEIADIQHLRSGIHIPAAALGAEDFGTLEKKETRKASSGHSNGVIP